ncbi:hypothetical protein EPUL_002141 [Erysiphe pulchra]|uniref:Retrotransposon gag domain-containing protein n=1 Tax=Erysiphe pulchra TaxID=225359 RepID=A0A2S4PUA6_9PEZI|nr:hypothetical protein EPUL_002141 [Erysiphe pulchra]
MARFNKEATEDMPTEKNSGNRCYSLIDQLDCVSKTELITKKDVLQLATHCCNVYDYWITHPEEFRRDHETRTKRRQTLLSLSHAARGDQNNKADITDDMDAVDLREYTDLFLNHDADINLRSNSTSSLHYADLHIEAQNAEIENLRTENEKYRDVIVRPREEVEALPKERDNLKLNLDRLSIQNDCDSDDKFLKQGTQKVNNLPELITKPAALKESSNIGAAHGRTLSGALAELDRAFRAYDTRRDAKTKLETLTMGNQESFGDFFAKFQIQINKLDYHNDDKIDELKARLNGRFAGKIISGRKETYEGLVNQCFTLDSELKMYDAKRTNSSTNGSRYLGGSSTSKPNVDHATVELGKSFKPLSQMTLKELKDYRNSLPRFMIIKQRLIDKKKMSPLYAKGTY